MDSTLEVRRATTPSNVLSWRLWLVQVASILRLETRKNFLSKRSLLIYALALVPVALLSVVAVFPPPARDWQDFKLAGFIYAVIYQALILRTVIFFGCAWIFMNLVRGEVIDRSLHYYFLAPVRREVLIVGKYFAGLLAALVFFGATTILSMVLVYVPHYRGAGVEFMLSAGGVAQALTYLGITALACVGYGAIFLVVGLFFRNPIIPALVVYGWEWLNFLLPPVLKKISVVHYLQSLLPVPLSEGPFAFLAEPTPAWISVPGLLLFTLLVLVLAGWRIRRMEISYGGE